MAWRGTAGKAGSSSSYAALPSTFHSVSQCAVYCGSFSTGSRFAFYTGALAQLPHPYYQCTCYDPSSWTVVDASATSGFVHGVAVGTAHPAFAAIPPPTNPIATGYVKPAQGSVLAMPTNLTTTSEFEISLTIVTPSTPTQGNILRISPWRIDDCRPCLALNGNGQLAASLYFSEKGWWKFATTRRPLAANTFYAIKIVLRDRRLRLFVNEGVELTDYPLMEATAGLSLAGEFPHAEPCIVYAGKGSNGNVAGVFIDADSIRIQNTVFSHRLLSFDFDAGLLTNSIRFHVGFEAPSLTHASEIAAYAQSSPSKAVLTSDGYAGRAARFDRRAALVLQSSESFFVDSDFSGWTLCLWAKRELELNTLHTTLAGFGSEAAINFAAYFNDLAFSTPDHQLRAAPPSAGEPGSHWAHVCASLAVGGRKILYLNGTRVASAPAGAIAPATHPLGLGASLDPQIYESSGSNRGFGGVLDEVHAWGRQLSDYEVRLVFGA